MIPPERALLEAAAEGFADDWAVSEFTAQARALLAKQAPDEELASFQRGVADMEAGRTQPWDEAKKDLGL